MIEKEQEKYLKKVRKVVDAAITKTAEQIFNDLTQTFDKCIDEFYSRETEYYYRHETGRGTGTGINLYRANQMKIIYNGNTVSRIVGGWNGSDMLPYKLSGGKVINTEHVVDSVMNGIRFNGDGSFYYPKMTWNIENGIQTNYFGMLTGKTPKQIFDQMLNQMYDVQKRLASLNFRSLYKTMMK